MTVAAKDQAPSSPETWAQGVIRDPAAFARHLETVAVGIEHWGRYVAKALAQAEEMLGDGEEDESIFLVQLEFANARDMILDLSSMHRYLELFTDALRGRA